MRHRRLVVGRQAGQNLVELALLMPILLWLSAGLIDFGRAYYTYTGLTNASREGARYAAAVAPICDASTVQTARNRVKGEQSALGLTDGMIAVDCSVDDRRTVRITFAFRPITPLVGEALDNPDGSGTIPLTTWATLPVGPQ
jgi:Flp pilus assembly protein TadG